MSTDNDTGAYSEARYRQLSKSLVNKAEETQQLEDRVKGKVRGGAIKPPFRPVNLAKLLEIDTTHAKCVYSKGRNVAGFGLEIIPHPEVADPDESQREVAEQFWFGTDSKWQVGPVTNERATPADVLEMGWIDYEGIGWLSLEILTQTDGTPIGLAYVPAMTVRRRKEKRGFVQIKRGNLQYFGSAGDRYADSPVFVDGESGETGPSVNNPANELIFKRNHSPLYTHYGAPDIIPGIPTIEADDAARNFNIDFFENNAVPRIAIIVEGGELTEGARKDIHDLLHGMRDERHRTIVLEVEKLLEDSGQIAVDENADDVTIRVEPLTVGLNEDASFQDFRDRNEHEILKTHEVPPIEAGQIKSGSFSTDAQAQRRGYIETVIQPKQEALSQLLYETIHDALGVTDYTVRFKTRGVDTRLHDAEVAQARIGASQGAITVNEAREELGLEPFTDDEGNELPIGSQLLADLQADGDGGGGGGSEFFSKSAAEQAPPAINKVGTRPGITVDVAKDPIEQVQFDSSNLAEGLYDYGERELYIRFHRADGQDSMYVYVDVPAAVWDGLVNAGSHGQYHYYNIRLEYGYEEITGNHDRLPEGPTPESLPEGIPG